jgi:rfaE bifunctional protein nucleotidyltransferase chain/domain
MQNSLQPIQDKIYNLVDLVKKVDQWRKQGEKIVFTNGCFDLLHTGHLYVLSVARQSGDRLIVGLNNDNSVRKLKGEGRPVKDEHTRALLLAALQMVDAVVLFGEPTPENLIKTILPDVLVKGGDYSVNQVVGSDIVDRDGGQTVIVPFLKGHSTTQLQQSILKTTNND